jgi:hypothetical protein
MELGHQVKYTLERVFGVQNLKVRTIFFYCFLPFDNCLKKILLICSIILVVLLNFKVNARENFSFMF